MIISTDYYNLTEIEQLSWTLWYDNWPLEYYTFDEYLTIKMHEIYPGNYRCETFMRLDDIQKLKTGVHLIFPTDEDAHYWILRFSK